MTEDLQRQLDELQRQFPDADPDMLRRVLLQGIKDRSLHREEVGNEYVTLEEQRIILEYKRGLQKIDERRGRVRKNTRS